MSITKSLIFTKVAVNGIDYTEHLEESVEITPEPVTTRIEDGQTLPDAWDVNFSVALYDSAPLTDSNIYTNTAQDPTKSNIVFSGAPGSATLTLTSMIINGNKTYENNRMAVVLSGSKRVASLANAVTES